MKRLGEKDYSMFQKLFKVYKVNSRENKRMINQGNFFNETTSCKLKISLKAELVKNEEIARKS